ncbi:MAG: Hsp20/alpha crystallin family protein [Parachlamydiales bacterium]|nr:Hsp20/alpha crystallin family protein [Parachlamydiales bacterium]
MRRPTLLPSLFDEIDTMRKSFFGDEWDTFPLISKSEASGLSVYEDNDKIYVEAAVPGIKPENINITFEKGVLIIKGESKEEKKEVKYHMKSASCFYYTLPLPERIDESLAPEATCKEGILKIAFNKSKKEKAKKIEIKVE